MIFTASYRRRALQQWQTEQAEVKQELSAASDTIALGLKKLTGFLFAPLITWLDR